MRRGRRYQQLRGRTPRHLGAKGIEVLEVERPKYRRRSSRRNLEKSDPSDAEAAARAVLAGEASGVPKSGNGHVEMIRALRAARRSAIKARTQAANQLQGLRVTAPEQLRRRLRGLSTKELVSVAARFRLGDDPRDVPAATRFALRSVARRYEALSAEIAELEAHLDRLVAQVAPELVSLPGIGTENAATLLIVAGDNPQRLGSEASFANLCGVAPIEASSGKVVRHRLNRAGNREANRALYMVCLARMRRDRPRQDYVALGAPRRARASERSSAASSATSPGRSTACLSLAAPVPRRPVRKPRATSPPGAAPLDHRSVTRVNKG